MPSKPPERRSLPVAFDKNAIVQKLVEIAHTNEDGSSWRLRSPWQ
jgi:hypothetical protein